MIVLLMKISAFIEEHPLWTLLILIVISSYFIPVPYLHDFIRWITKSIWDFMGISSTG